MDDNWSGDMGCTGIEGPLRKGDGEWVIRLSGFLSFSYCLHAELEVILWGLDLAWTRGYRRLVWYSDSLLALHLLAQPAGANHCYASVIKAIRMKRQSNWVVDLRHSLREANSCADLLAKLGSQQEDPWTVWMAPPIELGRLLSVDVLRTVYLCA